jgi:hypothetical protein
MICKQKRASGVPCGERASFRYTWPGKRESLICALHAEKLRGIAEAMGLELELVPVPGVEHEWPFEAECPTCHAGAGELCKGETLCEARVRA